MRMITLLLSRTRTTCWECYNISLCTYCVHQMQKLTFPKCMPCHFPVTDRLNGKPPTFIQFVNYIHTSHWEISIRGRATVWDVLVVSRLWHVLQVYPTTRTFMDKVQSEGRAFFMHKTWSQVSYDKLLLPRSQGGIFPLNNWRYNYVGSKLYLILTTVIALSSIVSVLPISKCLT